MSGRTNSMKTKPKLKPRQMWANCYSSDNAVYAHPTKQAALRRSFGHALLNAVPVAVIPLDDVEALISAASRAFTKQEVADGLDAVTDHCIRAALVAIGVLPKPRKQRR